MMSVQPEFRSGADEKVTEYKGIVVERCNILYNRFEHMAEAYVPLIFEEERNKTLRVPRLQDYLNREESKMSGTFLITFGAYFQHNGKEDYELTDLTQKEGARPGEIPVGSIDAIYLRDSHGLLEESKKAEEECYTIDVRVYLNRLDESVSGKLLLHRDFEGVDYLRQLKRILRRRQFIALMEPNNRQLATRLGRHLAGEPFGNPMLINTRRIRDIELGNGHAKTLEELLTSLTAGEEIIESQQSFSFRKNLK